MRVKDPEDWALTFTYIISFIYSSRYISILSGPSFEALARSWSISFLEQLIKSASHTLPSSSHTPDHDTSALTAPGGRYQTTRDRPYTLEPENHSNWAIHWKTVKVTPLTWLLMPKVPGTLTATPPLHPAQLAVTLSWNNSCAILWSCK